jgi:hypothetical protein
MEIDHEIEQFWLGFKTSMVNFYKSTNVNRPIDKWSEHLNSLQSKKKYHEIEKYIIYYLSLYGNDLLRHSASYNINILYTNIKRWDKISLKYKMYNKTNSKYINVTFLLIDIYALLIRNNESNQELFDELELYIEFHDYSRLINYSIEKKYPSIIDKILKYDNTVFEQLREILDFDNSIKYPISAIKLFKTCSII